jgi:hypothetical protein
MALIRAGRKWVIITPGGKDALSDESDYGCEKSERAYLDLRQSSHTCSWRACYLPKHKLPAKLRWTGELFVG